jgi:hypothetical protein
MVAIIRSGSVQAAQHALRARPWEATGSVDVEALVHWAYADQMVERFASVGLHAVEAVAAGFEPHGRSACGVARMMDIGNLGCAIDVSGPVRDAVHSVAYAVERTTGRLGQATETVRHFARLGSRPTSWRPPERWVRPAFYAADGVTAQVEYEGPGKKGAFCSVVYTWDSVREQFGRATYLRWWDGLDALAWELSKMALGFTVTAPMAPREPWA